MNDLVRANLELLQGDTVLLSSLNAAHGYDQLEFYQHEKLGLNSFHPSGPINPLFAKSGVQALSLLAKTVKR